MPPFSVLTALALAHKALAVCTNSLLRATTCCGFCVRTMDSDTQVHRGRTGDIFVVLVEGVNAELMTDCMFSVSHPTGGVEGNDA